MTRYIVRAINHGWRIYDTYRGEHCFGYWFSDHNRAIRAAECLNRQNAERNA